MSLLSLIRISYLTMALVVLGMLNNVNAQTMEPSAITTTEVEGTVLKIDNNRLTLETDDGVKEYVIPSNIKISRNTGDAALTELQPNDRVTLLQTENGEIIGLDATSARVVETTRTGVPIALAAVVGLFLLISFLKKSQQKHIKTDVLTNS